MAIIFKHVRSLGFHTSTVPLPYKYTDILSDLMIISEVVVTTVCHSHDSKKSMVT